jgi:DNA-binding SARP family transcriptional activator
VKRIQTLGGLAVFEGPRPLGGNAQQPRRLAIAVLARAGDRGVSRDRLAGLLWGDVEEERARRSLNQALYALRQEFGSEETILGTRELRLNAELIEVDLEAFETARAFAGVMVLLKLGVDAMGHLFEHRRLAAERPSA